MMFSCCHPRLSEAAQVGLILHTLCGFSIYEIAQAFLNSPAAVEKRILRGKNVLAKSKRLFDLEADDLTERLPAVQRALYLLFNEGYHGAHPELVVRRDLCEDAVRLVALLIGHARTATPSTYALGALMSLHLARLPARTDVDGQLHALAEQDRSLWDTGRIAEGLQLFERSATKHDVTTYHFEAAIAAVHASARRTDETDWAMIVALYDALLVFQPSPVVALNRAIAIGQLEGPARGLQAIATIADRDRLTNYPFYFAALGEFELRCDHPDAAHQHFIAALRCARNSAERHLLERRVIACKQ